MLSGKGSNFSVKTTVHIHRLFEKFGFDELFGRSAVMELLEQRGSGVSRKNDCIFQKPEKCFHLTRNNFQRNSADGISIVLSLGDTNIEKLYIDWIVAPVWQQSNCADRLHKL